MIFYDAHMNQRRKTIHLGQEGKRHFLFLGSFKFVESNDMSALLMWQLLLSGVLLDRSSDLLHAVSAVSVYLTKSHRVLQEAG